MQVPGSQSTVSHKQRAASASGFSVLTSHPLPASPPLMKLPAQAQTLYGNLERDGATVIGIDSDSGQPLDWSGMLAPGHAHLILNLDGYGVVLGENIRLSIFPGMTAICRIPREGSVYASRLPGSGRHRCVVLTV